MNLSVYKKGKAVVSRTFVVVSLGLVMLFGSRDLYYLLADLGWFEPISVGGIQFGLPEIVVGVVVLLCSGGIWWVINNPRMVDFLIGVEAELGKVSWSPWHQVVGSTVVVFVSVAVLGVFILVVDLVVARLMALLVGGGG